MVATFRGVDWGGQAGPFKRVNVRSHPSAPARWEWGDRCRHSVKRSGRTVQQTAVRETSRNDGRWRCWDGGLQTPENSSFGYFTYLIFILQILWQILIFFLQILSFYFTDSILLYRFHFLFYRLFYSFLIFYFTDFNFNFYRFLFFILQNLFCSFYFTDFILLYRFDFTDLIFILQILFCSFYFTYFIFILLYRFYFLFYRFDFTDLFLILVFILKIITDIELYCSEYSATTTKSGKNHSRIFQF